MKFKIAIQGWRPLTVFVLLTAIMLSAGCSIPDSMQKQLMPDNTGNNQTSPPHAQEPAATTTERMAKSDEGKISLQCERVLPDWKPIVVSRVNIYESYRLYEDGQGMLHLIYRDDSDNSTQIFHRIQKADGGWSEPLLIGDSANNWAGIAPDGSLCYAWAEFEIEYELHSSEVLHIKYYRDGQWQDDPTTYDFNGERDKYGFDIFKLQVSFDTQGQPHFLYWVQVYFELISDKSLHTFRAMLLDDKTLLISEEVDGEVMEPEAEGIGNLDVSVHFHIDSENIYHLLGYDASALVPDSYYPVYTRYIHNYSLDGGETWEGPFVVFENEDGMAGDDEVSFTETPDGSLRLMTDFRRSDNLRLTTTLQPGNVRFSAPEEYYNFSKFRDDLETFLYEETFEYSMNVGLLWNVFFDITGSPHYFTDHGFTEWFWDTTQVAGNVWMASEIKKPAEGADPARIFLRQSGDIVLLAIVADELYSAEIPCIGGSLKLR